MFGQTAFTDSSKLETDYFQCYQLVNSRKQIAENMIVHHITCFSLFILCSYDVVTLFDGLITLFPMLLHFLPHHTTTPAKNHNRV